MEESSQQTTRPNEFLTGLAAGAITVLGGASVLFVPAYAAMLRAADVQLPVLTNFLIAVPTAAWAALGPIGCGLTLLKNRAFSRRTCVRLDVLALVSSFALGVAILVFVLRPASLVIQAVK